MTYFILKYNHALIRPNLINIKFNKYKNVSIEYLEFRKVKKTHTTVRISVIASATARRRKIITH